MKTTLTTLEEQLIKGIKESDYFDSCYPTDPIWMPYPKECGFDNNKTMSGVVSSLVKKGLIQSDGQGKDATLNLTDKYVSEFISEIPTR